MIIYNIKYSLTHNKSEMIKDKVKFNEDLLHSFETCNLFFLFNIFISTLKKHYYWSKISENIIYIIFYFTGLNLLLTLKILNTVFNKNCDFIKTVFFFI